MKITHNKLASGSTMQLEGELTIYTVSDAKNALFSDINSIVDPLLLDTTKITAIDSAGVQLLLFVKKMLINDNKRTYIESSNDLVDTALNTLSVKKLFHFD